MSARQLPARVKVLYGVGAVAESVKFFTFGLFLLFFYTTVLGLPGTLVGAAAAIGLVWDAVIDPLMGHASDGARLPFGRRHSFMLVGSVCAGLTFVAVFNPPDGLATPALFAWLVGSNLLLRTAISAYTVPYYALGAELAPDYDERTAVAGVRAVFAMSGTLLVAALSFSVFFPGQTGRFDPQGYASMGLALGAVIAIAGLIATTGTLGERQRLSAAALPADRLTFSAGMRLAFGNDAFLALLISGAVFFLASVVNASLAVHYLTFYAGIREGSSVALFQLAFFAGALPGVAAWLRVSRRVDKHRLHIAGLLGTAAVMAAASLLVGADRLIAPGQLAPLVAGNATAGFFASALWVLPLSMVADVADDDELRTGVRREATFYGAYSMGQQLAAGAALIVTGLAVDYFAGLVPGQQEQSASTVARIGLLFGMFPAALLMLAALLMSRYPLTRARVNDTQRLLAARRVPRLSPLVPQPSAGGTTVTLPAQG